MRPYCRQSESTSSRQSSVTKNAFPSVSSPIVAVISAEACTPAVSRTNSATSPPESPPSRMRTTPSVRPTATSVSERSAGTSASASRNVATRSIRTSAPARTR